MIILSVGMPRAGSGWHYNLIHDLNLANGGQDAREIRRRYHLQRVLTEVNCNIGSLSSRRLLAVSVPLLFGNTFVIKAHAGPTPVALNFIRRGWLRATYIYREPRDAMLSAMEYGQRSLENGRPNAFSSLVDFPAAVEFMRTYLHIAEAWIATPNILHVRYENLLNNYDTEAKRLLSFLHIDAKTTAVKNVLERYRPAQAKEIGKGVHFSKGKTGRYRDRFTDEQQELLVQQFGVIIQHLGYLP